MEIILDTKSLALYNISKKHIKYCKELTKLAIEYANEVLKLDSNIKINLTVIKNTSYGAIFYPHDKTIDISLYSKNFGTILTALAHELIHVDQVVRGSLQLTSNKRVYMWNNKKYKLINGICNYEKYKKLPWEKEAFEKQDLIAKYITEKIVSESNGSRNNIIKGSS